MTYGFTNRRAAGQLLAKQLIHYANRDDVLVLGLARGGVPVAFEVAQALNLPMDVFIVRKLGVPGHEELAMGAIASGGTWVLNRDIVQQAQVNQYLVDEVVAQEQQELERRERIYREGKPLSPIKGRTVILVDDGLATGASMLAAVTALREYNPSRIVAAVPTAPPQVCEAIRSAVDELICAITPEEFEAVGRWYHDFSQTTDQQVRDLLHEAGQGFSLN